MARTISFLNFKGGVGKTSLVVNLAACLGYLGKKVLVVDCDPQSNASVWLLRLDRWNGLHAEPGRFLRSYFAGEVHDPASLVLADAVRGPDGSVALPGVDILPTSFALMDVEHDLPAPSGRSLAAAFHGPMAALAGRYDFVLFDCPPNFFKTTQWAVFGSTEVVVPAFPDGLSILGLHLLIRRLERFLAASAEERATAGAGLARITAVVLNNIRPGVNYDIPRQLLRQKLEAFRGRPAVDPAAGLAPVEVRSAVAIGRASTAGVPAVLLPKAEGSAGVVEDYLRLARWLVDPSGGPPAAQVPAGDPAEAPAPA